MGRIQYTPPRMQYVEPVVPWPRGQGDTMIELCGEYGSSFCQRQRLRHHINSLGKRFTKEVMQPIYDAIAKLLLKIGLIKEI